MSADGRMLRAALAYAERFGFQVLPVRSRGKQPLTEHGCKDASKDSRQIRMWWERWPDANIGMATGALSGVVVLDVDPLHGGDESLAALAAKYGNLPITPIVITGGGGRHIYFKYPVGVGRIPNSAGTLGAGLDVRGAGGYVIAPPSVHVSGNQYAWKPSLRIDEVVISPLPSWVTDLAMNPPIRPAANQTVRWPTGTTGGRVGRLDLTHLAEGVPEGNRDWELFRLACHLRWRGYPREHAEQIVVDAATRCRPPFPTRAALRKVDSAWRYAP